MASIDFDVEDYLDEASTESLRREIKRRGKTEAKIRPGIEVWGPAGLAEDIRSAYYRRDANRLELLLTVLEQHAVDA